MRWRNRERIVEEGEIKVGEKRGGGGEGEREKEGQGEGRGCGEVRDGEGYEDIRR